MRAPRGSIRRLYVSVPNSGQSMYASTRNRISGDRTGSGPQEQPQQDAPGDHEERAPLDHRILSRLEWAKQFQILEEVP